MNAVEEVRRNIKRWGQDAALRNAKKNHIPFVVAYAAVFDRLPRK